MPDPKIEGTFTVSDESQAKIQGWFNDMLVELSSASEWIKQHGYDIVKDDSCNNRTNTDCEVHPDYFDKEPKENRLTMWSMSGDREIGTVLNLTPDAELLIACIIADYDVDTAGEFLAHADELWTESEPKDMLIENIDFNCMCIGDLKFWRKLNNEYVIFLDNIAEKQWSTEQAVEVVSLLAMVKNEFGSDVAEYMSDHVSDAWYEADSRNLVEAAFPWSQGPRGTLLSNIGLWSNVNVMWRKRCDEADRIKGQA